MKPRYLTILIVVLYCLSAVSLLGIGSNREKLQKLQQPQEQTAAEEPEQDAVTEPMDYTASRQELQTRLMIWQIVALSLFGVASLLLVLKDRLIKKPESLEERARSNGQP